MTNAEYPSPSPRSNRTHEATLVAQARLKLLQEATETRSGRQAHGLRETAERLAIFVELLQRLSRSAGVSI